MSLRTKKSCQKNMPTKQMKTNITGKWCNLGRVVCESVDTAVPNRRMKSQDPPQGRWQVLGVQTTPGFCLQPNIQLPVPTDVGVSCKDYSNKVPRLEESVLLTRIERYFTEAELTFFTLTYILLTLASKRISLNASPIQLMGHRTREYPGTSDKEGGRSC